MTLRPPASALQKSKSSHRKAEGVLGSRLLLGTISFPPAVRALAKGSGSHPAALPCACPRVWASLARDTARPALHLLTRGSYCVCEKPGDQAPIPALNRAHTLCQRGPLWGTDGFLLQTALSLPPSLCRGTARVVWERLGQLGVGSMVRVDSFSAPALFPGQQPGRSWAGACHPLESLEGDGGRREHTVGCKGASVKVRKPGWSSQCCC